MRVVRFYKNCSPPYPPHPPPPSPPYPPPYPPPPLPHRPPLSRYLRLRLRQMHVAMGSARSRLQATDRSVQRRTSTASAGWQCAAPGLARGAPSEVCSAGPQLPEKKIRKYVRKECQKYVRQECQKNRQ